MSETQKLPMFIGGKFVEAENQHTYEVKNPANGNTVGIVSDAGRADARKAIDAASTAFKSWAKVPAKSPRSSQQAGCRLVR